jgi:cyclase
MTCRARTWTRPWSLSLACAVGIFTLAAGVAAQQDRAVDKPEIHILPVQGAVYMLVGAGSNITLQVGDQTLLIVDTGVPQMSAQVLAAVRTVSPKPIQYIINTSGDPDHTGGNQNISQAGRFNSGLNGEIPGASIVAHLSVLDRMTAPVGKDTAVPQELWPTDTYDTDRWALFNGEAVIVEHPHAAHTDGDSVVLFRRSDVISTGDIFTPEVYPVIDLSKGGSIQGEIDALNRVLDIMVPKANEEGGTYVIPGHGRLCDRAVVADYRDMVTIVRDRIEDLVKKGKTIDQVEAAKPTLDYDGIYGVASGPWTTQMFIEAVYRDLSLSKGSPGQKTTGQSP